MRRTSDLALGTAMPGSSGYARVPRPWVGSDRVISVQHVRWARKGLGDSSRPSHTLNMTPVALAMTGAPASAGVQSRPEPGLAVYVGLDPGVGPAGRALLVDLARAVANVVAELAPRATTHSALTLGGHGPHGPVSYTHLRAHETRHDLVC